MNKTQQKLSLIKNIPKCPLCGTKLEIIDPTPPHKSVKNQAAILDKTNGLICFGCRCIRAKTDQFNKLPWKTKFYKNIDKMFGIFSYFKKLRGRLNKFIYFNIKKHRLYEK